MEEVAENVAPVVTPDEGGAAEACALLEAQRVSVLDTRLAASGLPGPLQELVRGGLRAEWKLAELDEAIGKARTSWAKLEEERTVRGMTPVDVRLTGMLSSLDQVQIAVDGLLAGRRPDRGVKPLTGIREFYMLMSGDYDMRGMFMPENVGLANVNSSTMAGLVANAMNKVLIHSFGEFPRWWEQLCTVEDFASLQQIRWITLGGIGDLPSVAEGAAYTELAWDDNTEVSDWVKKGGYLGITLEAIDKDDTRRIMQAGPALARSAWLSLSKGISSIFTSNAGTGPHMADGYHLFDAAQHGNLGTSALSYASWVATRLAMRKFPELHSGERLGGLTAPKFLLVPPDLEGTALQILGSEGMPDTANNNVNPESVGDGREARLAAARRRIIVMDLWTDVNDWAAVADPMLYPSIGLGFRFGREPEIFSVASPTSGLMFTNDIMPIKVRFFYAVGPTDYRGLYKHNVS